MPAVIDASGRLALTMERAAAFPGGRAHLLDDPDGIRVVRP